MKRVLCYGHDHLLLLTRKWILGVHYAVDTCCGLPELTAHLRTERMNLAILCHTVDTPEAKRIILALRDDAPGTSVLQLSKQGQAIATTPAEARFVTLESPLALLREVHSIMVRMPEANAELPR